jgi:hypothetical protein
MWDLVHLAPTLRCARRVLPPAPHGATPLAASTPPSCRHALAGILLRFPLRGALHDGAGSNAAAATLLGRAHPRRGRLDSAPATWLWTSTQKDAASTGSAPEECRAQPARLTARCADCCIHIGRRREHAQNRGHVRRSVRVMHAQTWQPACPLACDARPGGSTTFWGACSTPALREFEQPRLRTHRDA